MAYGVESGLLAFGGQEVPHSFVEETSLKLALESQPGQKIQRHTEITLADGGMSEIVDQISGKPTAKYTTFADPDLNMNYDHDTSTLTGVIEPKESAEKEGNQVTVDYDPSRNQTTTLRDSRGNAILSSYGACLQNVDGSGGCNFSIAGKFDAKIDGSRTYIPEKVEDGAQNHFKVHYVLHPAGDDNAKLGTVDIESKLIGKKIIMDVEITRD